MADSTTISVRLPAEIRDQLGRLASTTKRTRSFLAGEAIARYVQRELQIVEGLQRGLADAKAGRLVPHDEAMDRLDATIEAIARESTKRRRA